MAHVATGAFAGREREQIAYKGCRNLLLAREGDARQGLGMFKDYGYRV